MENDRDQPYGRPAGDPVAEGPQDAAVDEARHPLDDPARPGPDALDRADPLDHPDQADDLLPGGATALPPRIEAWRKRSAAGAILTGFALGLQEALEKRKEDPSIVMETSGDPPRDLPVEAEFEYGRPRQSVVQIRPWLLPDSAKPDPGGGVTGDESGEESPEDRG